MDIYQEHGYKNRIAIKTLDEVIPPPHNNMVDNEHMKIAIAWKEIKTILNAQRIAPNLIFEWLAKSFDCPCSYAFNGEEVTDFIAAHDPDWCEKNCGKVKDFVCWEKYLSLKLRRV